MKKNLSLFIILLHLVQRELLHRRTFIREKRDKRNKNIIYKIKIYQYIIYIFIKGIK